MGPSGRRRWLSTSALMSWAMWAMLTLTIWSGKLQEKYSVF